MELQTDFRDLLALLNEHKVEYLIVGKSVNMGAYEGRSPSAGAVITIR